MRHRLISILVVAVFCLTACVWYGCSDNSVTTVISEDDYIPTDETSYFLPMTEGFTTVYSVAYASGGNATITLAIGRQVQNGTVTAYEWFSNDGSVFDTGYVVMTTDAAFYYDGVDADPEKILSLPLVAGNTWERFSETYNNDGFTDIITGIITDDDDPSTLDGTVAKTIPTTGGNIMTVIGEEQLQLSNGQFLSNTFKLYNEGSTQGKKNYYWYAAGVGLVKYIIGTTDGSYPRGDVVGELIDFGS